MFFASGMMLWFLFLPLLALALLLALFLRLLRDRKIERTREDYRRGTFADADVNRGAGANFGESAGANRHDPWADMQGNGNERGAVEEETRTVQEMYRHLQGLTRRIEELERQMTEEERARRHNAQTSHNAQNTENNSAPNFAPNAPQGADNTAAQDVR